MIAALASLLNKTVGAQGRKVLGNTRGWQIKRGRDCGHVLLTIAQFFDEAQAIAGSAEAWLVAIDHFADEPHAPQVAKATLERFGDVLQDAERARLSAVAAIAASEGSETNDSGG